MAEKKEKRPQAARYEAAGRVREVGAERVTEGADGKKTIWRVDKVVRHPSGCLLVHETGRPA